MHGSTLVVGTMRSEGSHSMHDQHIELLLSKLIPIVAYPLGGAIALGAIALVLSFTRFQRFGRALLAGVLIGLWIMATPAFANWMSMRLESQFPPVRVEALPNGDAVIVLGGFLRQPAPPRVTPDLTDAGDRALQALRIFRAGTARHIVISGGNLPWQAGLVAEAELIADLLVELGVPRSALTLDSRSRNTHENALNTAVIFKENGWGRGILVTSATHMPRAVESFRKAGVEVIPAPTDVLAIYPREYGLFDFLPDAGALVKTTSAIKEMIGHKIYIYQGWV
jgi:uncharacterized SAM-binding protein YcdF (DUF218 family)